GDEASGLPALKIFCSLNGKPSFARGLRERRSCLEFPDQIVRFRLQALRDFIVAPAGHDLILHLFEPALARGSHGRYVKIKIRAAGQLERFGVDAEIAGEGGADDVWALRQFGDRLSINTSA